MIKADKFTGKTVAVFGLGKSGQAAIRALSEGGARVFASDDSTEQMEKYKSLNATFSRPDEFPWSEIKTLVLSPGVPLTHPKPHKIVELAKQHGAEIIGDIEVLFRQCPEAKYIGITGTNGKSTTTALIGHILKNAGLKVQVGGNLGTPVLDFEPLGRDGYYVIESSSYQLDLLSSVRYNFALLLNITPDHLDRHGDMIGYTTAKKKIFDRQEKGDFAITSIDDVYVKGIHDYFKTFGCKATLVPVSVTSQIYGGVYAMNGVIYNAINAQRTTEYDIGSVQSLRGMHNWQNACFAVAASTAAGLESGAIFSGLTSFPGLAHRMEKVAEIEGIMFVNDSKATNADAAAKALGSYSNIFWIAGGKPKEGGIESLERFFPVIRKAYLIGAATDEFAKTLEGKVEYEKCGDLENAFRRASEDALKQKTPDSVVLLSPACASFDQWPNFEARGDAFRTHAEELAKNHGKKAA